MNVFKAVLLGLVQGLTEFLPVSSSGHLVLGQHLLGIEQPELLFDVILHLGTLLAVFLIFSQEIWTLILEFFQLPLHLRNRDAASDAWRNRPYFRMLVLIIVGSIPTGLMGLFLKDFFESLFASTLAVGLALLITGGFLFFTQWVRGEGLELRRVRPWDALVVGFFQGLAIAPGLSRSGLTISGGLFMGMERELAAKFSFLLSIPAILGALVLELKDGGLDGFSPAVMGAGFLAALASGLLALVVLLRLVKNGKLHFFAYYCWLVGIAATAWSLWGR